MMTSIFVNVKGGVEKDTMLCAVCCVLEECIVCYVLEEGGSGSRVGRVG